MDKWLVSQAAITQTMVPKKLNKKGTKVRKLSISAINIVMPKPHSPERYINLLQEAKDMKKPINLRGDFQGMLGSVRPKDDEGYVSGEIYKYFNLRIDTQWFNMQEQKPAEEADLFAIRVPEHLKPHFKYFHYVFSSKHHRLFLITQDLKDSMAPSQAQKLFKGLFSSEEIVQKYGEIEVHIEPQHETLDRILSIPCLKKLYVEITPPNTDDFHAIEEAIFGDMDRQNAKRLSKTLIARDRNGLSPSNETKILAKVAQSNGHVEGSGLDADGSSVKVSTLDHPYVEQVTYNPATEDRAETLKSKAYEMLGHIIGRPSS